MNSSNFDFLTSVNPDNFPEITGHAWRITSIFRSTHICRYVYSCFEKKVVKSNSGIELQYDNLESCIPVVTAHVRPYIENLVTKDYGTLPIVSLPSFRIKLQVLKTTRDAEFLDFVYRLIF
jgi:hypothetical protein